MRTHHNLLLLSLPPSFLPSFEISYSDFIAQELKRHAYWLHDAIILTFYTVWYTYYKKKLKLVKMKKKATFLHYK